MNYIIPIGIMVALVVVVSILWCNALERTRKDWRHHNDDYWDWP